MDYKKLVLPVFLFAAICFSGNSQTNIQTLELNVGYLYPVIKTEEDGDLAGQEERVLHYPHAGVLLSYQTENHRKFRAGLNYNTIGQVRKGNTLLGDPSPPHTETKMAKRTEIHQYLSLYWQLEKDIIKKWNMYAAFGPSLTYFMATKTKSEYTTYEYYWDEPVDTIYSSYTNHNKNTTDVLDLGIQLDIGKRINFSEKWRLNIATTANYCLDKVLFNEPTEAEQYYHLWFTLDIGLIRKLKYADN